MLAAAPQQQKALPPWLCERRFCSAERCGFSLFETGLEEFTNLVFCSATSDLDGCAGHSWEPSCFSSMVLDACKAVSPFASANMWPASCRWLLWATSGP